MKLSTGPTSGRKCHHCNELVSQVQLNYFPCLIWMIYISLGLCSNLNLRKNIKRLSSVYFDGLETVSAQAWWSLGPSGSVAAWNAAGRTQYDPYKKGKPSLIRKIPGADDPSRIRSDLAHIWAIGTGKEFVGSSLLVLANELRAFPGRSVGAKLENAYALFRSWCSENKQSCKITEFELRTLKISSKLDICIVACFENCFLYI